MKIISESDRSITLQSWTIFGFILSPILILVAIFVPEMPWYFRLLFGVGGLAVLFIPYKQKIVIDADRNLLEMTSYSFKPFVRSFELSEVRQFAIRISRSTSTSTTNGRTSTSTNVTHTLVAQMAPSFGLMEIPLFALNNQQMSGGFAGMALGAARGFRDYKLAERIAKLAGKELVVLDDTGLAGVANAIKNAVMGGGQENQTSAVPQSPTQSPQAQQPIAPTMTGPNSFDQNQPRN